MDEKPLTTRVKAVLLCMQRDAWEQGLCAQALIAQGDEELGLLLAHDSVVHQADDGRLGVVGENRTVCDPAANGIPVLYAARRTGKPEYALAAKRMADWLLTTPFRTENGTLYHLVDRDEVWIDSIYMAPPFLAAAGHAGEAVRQIEGFRRLLWNEKLGLFSHKWDDGAKRFARSEFWSTGNGWAACGLAQVIAHLPATMARERTALGGCLRELIDGCLARLRPDGLYHDIMDDRASFVETNASQMIACAIYEACRTGILDTGYLESAERMRSAAQGKVDEQGFVRDVSGSPTFDRPGVSAEGQAFFLLMEAARNALNSPKS